MKEGFETEFFNRERLVNALRRYIEDKDYLYEGLILKESKQYYKKIEKDFIKTISKIINKFKSPNIK